MSTTLEYCPEKDRIHQRLDDVFSSVEKDLKNYFGYPPAEDGEAEILQRFSRLSMVNLGDPISETGPPGNTLELERELLSFFAERTRLREDLIRGYVTTGGSEGNMYGLFVARERFPNAPVFLSEASHVSIFKALRCLRMEPIPVDCRPDGTLDLDAFSESLRKNAHREAIVVGNAGNSMFGTTDDLRGIRRCLEEENCPKHHLHIDAALSGMILPFCPEPPAWDFHDGADSIAISVHKLLGMPFPCGVVLTREEHQNQANETGFPVTTLGGTRNALAPLLLWYLLEHHRTHGLRNLVHRSMVLADYALSRLREMDQEAWRDPNATTVVFRRPDEKVIRKWHLKTFEQWAQIVVLPHITMPRIDRFLEDLENGLAKK